VHVADVRKKIANHPQEIQQEKVNQEQREQGMKEEMWAWQRFKEGHNLK
jgi:hypothetical protein